MGEDEAVEGERTFFHVTTLALVCMWPWLKQEEGMAKVVSDSSWSSVVDGVVEKTSSLW
jgi:hypothetical protein